uniref:Uncharacterized protein n=1 Tax=Ananas comosus var. bracteatus TaxID=296719 RepID=A0A6V7QH41_ANACO|nr:unnamed protein product [Ananas comosus var. bracteatus]
MAVETVNSPLSKLETLLKELFLASVWSITQLLPNNIIVGASHFWHILVSNAAFRFALFVPVRKMFCSSPQNPGIRATLRIIIDPPRRHNSCKAATAFSFPFGLPLLISPTRLVTDLSTETTALATLCCFNSSASAPAASSATNSFSSAPANTVTAPNSNKPTQHSGWVERLKRAITASFLPLVVPSFNKLANDSTAPGSSTILFLYS